MPRADGRGKPFAFADDAADRADRHGMIGKSGIGMGQIGPVHRNPAMDAAPDIAEHSLGIDILRRPDAAPAGNAAIGVQRDIGVRGIEVAAGFQIGKPGCGGHVQPVRHRLQLAIAAFLADRAQVVALVEQHLDQIAAHPVARLGVVFDLKPRLGGLGAGRNAAPCGLDGADPAATLMAQPLHVAKTRDVDAGGVSGLHDGLARCGSNLDAVDTELERPVHLLKSLSKM